METRGGVGMGDPHAIFNNFLKPKTAKMKKFSDKIQNKVRNSPGMEWLGKEIREREEINRLYTYIIAYNLAKMGNYYGKTMIEEVKWK